MKQINFEWNFNFVEYKNFFILIFVSLFCLFLLQAVNFFRKNKYGWSEKRFSQMLKSKAFRKAELKSIYAFRSFSRKTFLTKYVFNFFLIINTVMFFFFIISFWENKLYFTKEETSKIYNLTYLNGAWLIKGNNSSFLILNSYVLIYLINLISIVFFVIFGFLFLRTLKGNLYKSFFWYKQLYDKATKQKWYLTYSLSIVGGVCSQILIAICLLEIPNIENFINSNGHLYVILNYYIKYSSAKEMIVVTYVPWYIIVALCIDFVIYGFIWFYFDQIERNIIFKIKNSIVNQYKNLLLSL